MEKFYISKNYRESNTASTKAKSDCEDIFQAYGYKNLGLSKKNYTNTFAGRIWTFLSACKAYINMPYGEVIILQYKTPFIVSLFNRAKQRKNKVILLIHDIWTLRGLPEEDYLEIIRDADGVISHTPNMQEWLNKLLDISRKNIRLEIFDYLLPGNPDSSITNYQNIPSICFAGNLKKAPFLTKLNFPENSLSFDLYGPGITEDMIENKSFIKYHGTFPPEKLISEIHNCMFGLVWDGDSINECTGTNGKYLQFNAPHKISLYLAAGKPVIIWKKMGMAQFIEKNNIGITIESLEEIPDRIKQLSEKEYIEMSRNVSVIKDKITQGEYLKEALDKIEQII